MLSTLILVVALSILLVVMIFSAVLTVLWTSVYICALFLLSVSCRTSFNISPFPVNWCYSAYSAVLDGKLFRRAYHCEKLLSRTAEWVCRS